MRKVKVLLTILYVGSAVFTQGCLVAAVGAGAAGTVAYLKGDLEVVESRNIDAVYAATKKALNELRLKVIKDNQDAISARIVARDAEDKKIEIKLNSASENTTRLSIRVGWFGDETKSRFIYQKVHDNLR